MRELSKEHWTNGDVQVNLQKRCNEEITIPLPSETWTNGDVQVNLQQSYNKEIIIPLPKLLNQAS